MKVCIEGHDDSTLGISPTENLLVRGRGEPDFRDVKRVDATLDELSGRSPRKSFIEKDLRHAFWYSTSSIRSSIDAAA